MSNSEPIIRLNGNHTPSVRGTRLTVYAIMDQYFAGDPIDQIAEIFRISIAEAQAATDYIDGHMIELMPKYQKMRQRDRAGDPPEVRARYAESHARLMALKVELERRKQPDLAGGGDARIAG